MAPALTCDCLLPRPQVKVVPTFLFLDEGAVVKRLSLRDVRRLAGSSAWVRMGVLYLCFGWALVCSRYRLHPYTTLAHRSRPAAGLRAS